MAETDVCSRRKTILQGRSSWAGLGSGPPRRSNRLTQFLFLITIHHCLQLPFHNISLSLTKMLPGNRRRVKRKTKRPSLSALLHLHISPFCDILKCTHLPPHVVVALVAAEVVDDVAVVGHVVDGAAAALLILAVFEGYVVAVVRTESRWTSPSRVRVHNAIA